MKRIIPWIVLLASSTAWAQWGEEKKKTSEGSGWRSPEKTSKWGAAPEPSTKEQRGSFGDRSAKIYVMYAPAQDELAKGLEQGLKKSQGFETLAGSLDSMFLLPRDLPIVIGSCGVINLFYDPQNHRIVVCYEYMEHLAELAQSQNLKFGSPEELGRWIGAVTVFGLFHEFGHALIGELELPSTGKEEDAVDEFASITLSRIGATGQMAALEGAHWFQMEDNEKHKRGVSNPYWDEHSFDLQRMASIVCILLGANPDKFKAVADGLDFPREREQRCLIDFPRKDKAWQVLLGPHLKNR